MLPPGLPVLQCEPLAIEDGLMYCMARSTQTLDHMLEARYNARRGLQAAAEIQTQLDDLARHTQLCNMFECADYVKPAYEAVMEAKEAMVMAKDVWDCASMVEQQFKAKPYSLPNCSAFCILSLTE